MELCQEGEAPECLWLLESGTVFAVDISCRPRHTVFAPAMFGDAMLVASQVPACRDRLYGYRTDTPCRMWRLSLRDMTSAQRVCPAIRIAYLAYLQVKLLQLLSGFPSDEQFCEVVARIMAVLEGADAEAREEVLEELQQVRACAPWDCMMHNPHITRCNGNDNLCLPEWPCPLPLPAPSPSSPHWPVLPLPQAKRSDNSLQSLLDALLELSSLSVDEGCVVLADIGRTTSDEAAAEASAEWESTEDSMGGGTGPSTIWPKAEQAVARLSRRLSLGRNSSGPAEATTGSRLALLRTRSVGLPYGGTSSPRRTLSPLAEGSQFGDDNGLPVDAVQPSGPDPAGPLHLGPGSTGLTLPPLPPRHGFSGLGGGAGGEYALPARRPPRKQLSSVLEATSEDGASGIELDDDGGPPRSSASLPAMRIPAGLRGAEHAIHEGEEEEEEEEEIR